jgi:hypothetical protein
LKFFEKEIAYKGGQMKRRERERKKLGVDLKKIHCPTKLTK